MNFQGRGMMFSGSGHNDEENTTLPIHLFLHVHNVIQNFHEFHYVHGDALAQLRTETTFSCALSTIMTLTSAMYQAKSQDPFDAFPVCNMLSSLTLVVCFCISLLLDKHPQLTLNTRHNLVWACIFLRIMALAVLTMVPLHNKLGWPVYLLCGFPLVLLMVKPLKQLFRWVQRGTVEAIHEGLYMFSRPVMPTTINLQDMLPV